MQPNSNSIAGLATAPGRSELGIVRISGPGALTIVKACFIPAEDISQKEVFYFSDGHAVFGHNRIPVPCRVFVMKEPYSYTREDVVEFHLPGSPELLDLFLRYCFSQGIRMPEPGEFTRRAFLNGRIDLVEAAGVMEVISASDRSQLAMARSLCFGDVSLKLENIENRIRDLLSMVEVSIDFTDQDVEIISDDLFLKGLDDILQEIENIKGRDRIGHDTVGEYHMVIAGMVNAGKSTLFNSLVGDQRCRVSPVPGTTRDMVSETVLIRNIPFVLYDSAGLSLKPGVFEEHARRIFQSKGHTSRGMLLLISPETEEMPGHLREFFLEKPGPARTIAVAAKTDLGIPNPSFENGNFDECFAVTYLAENDSSSIEGLKDLMRDMVRQERAQQNFSLTGMLDTVLETCRERLVNMRESMHVQESPECAAEELRQIRAELDRFGNDDPDDDILNRIFSSFCIGK